MKYAFMAIFHRRNPFKIRNMIIATNPVDMIDHRFILWIRYESLGNKHMCQPKELLAINTQRNRNVSVRIGFGVGNSPCFAFNPALV